MPKNIRETEFNQVANRKSLMIDTFQKQIKEILIHITEWQIFKGVYYRIPMKAEMKKKLNYQIIYGGQ